MPHYSGGPEVEEEVPWRWLRMRGGGNQPSSSSSGGGGSSSKKNATGASAAAANHQNIKAKGKGHHQSGSVAAGSGGLTSPTTTTTTAATGGGGSSSLQAPTAATPDRIYGIGSPLAEPPPSASSLPAGAGSPKASATNRAAASSAGASNNNNNNAAKNNTSENKSSKTGASAAASAKASVPPLAPTSGSLPGAASSPAGQLLSPTGGGGGAGEGPMSPTLDARPTLTLYTEYGDDEPGELLGAPTAASLGGGGGGDALAASSGLRSPTAAPLLTPLGGAGGANTTTASGHWSQHGRGGVAATPVVPLNPHADSGARQALASRMEEHFGPQGAVTLEERAEREAKAEREAADKARESRKREKAKGAAISILTVGTVSTSSKSASTAAAAAAPPTKEQIIRVGAQRLYRRLGKMQLVVHRVRNDGNCQFRAIAQQLLGSEHYHDVIRHHVVSYMRRVRAEKFDFYFGSLKQADRYFAHIARVGSWGDELTLRGASDSLFIKIHVLSSEERNFYITYEPSDDAPPPPTFLIDVDKYKEMRKRHAMQAMQARAHASASAAGGTSESAGLGDYGHALPLSPLPPYMGGYGGGGPLLRPMAAAGGGGHSSSAGTVLRDGELASLQSPTTTSSAFHNTNNNNNNNSNKGNGAADDDDDAPIDASLMQQTLQEKLSRSFVHPLGSAANSFHTAAAGSMPATVHADPCSFGSLGAGGATIALPGAAAAAPPAASDVQESVMGKFTRAGGQVRYGGQGAAGGGGGEGGVLQLLQPQPARQPIVSSSSGVTPSASAGALLTPTAGAAPTFHPAAGEEVALFVSPSPSAPSGAPPAAYSLPPSLEPSRASFSGYNGTHGNPSMNYNTFILGSNPPPGDSAAASLDPMGPSGGGGNDWLRTGGPSLADYAGAGGSVGQTAGGSGGGVAMQRSGNQLCFVFESRKEPVDVFLSYLYPVHFNALGVAPAPAPSSASVPGANTSDSTVNNNSIASAGAGVGGSVGAASPATAAAAALFGAGSPTAGSQGSLPALLAATQQPAAAGPITATFLRPTTGAAAALVGANGNGPSSFPGANDAAAAAQSQSRHSSEGSERNAPAAAFPEYTASYYPADDDPAEAPALPSQYSVFGKLET